MKKLTTNEFIKNFYSRYPNGLDLDLSEFSYFTSRTKSKTICKIHRNVIMNTANNLMQGIKRCKECKSEAISSVQRHDIQVFIKKSHEVHGNKYDYSKVIWAGTRTNVKIICNVHGEFYQNPQSHWNGYGCYKCGYSSLRKSKEEFEAESRTVHGDRYEYNLVEYVNNYSPVSIKCKKHGVFEMSPKDHLIYQRGCTKCFPGNRSWAETAWLDQLGIPYENRQKRITASGKTFLVDALVGNTVYEFWGDFWHGNPKRYNLDDKNTKCNKTYRELYENTVKKKESIKSAGYDLVEIWESDFRQ